MGALLGGKLANAIGRKRTMVGVAIGFAVFAVLCGLAPNEAFLVGARFLLGVTVGVSILAAPLVIAESAATDVRGGLLVTYQVATIAGIAIADFVGVALASGGHWRLMLGLSAIAGAAIARLPDTPRWCLMSGRREEARAVLERAGYDRVDAERRSAPAANAFSATAMSSTPV